ncbi:MAG: dienelactone hydrolase family protein [Actinomycetota bacterium]
MCYEPAARPPLPPVAGGAGAAEVEDLVLESVDGARFRAVSARTDAAGAPGIVILPDVRGLHPFYRELAVRFAEAGVHATAIDYFGRTAGVGERGEDFDHMAHVRRTTPDEVAMDVTTAVAHVRSAAGGGALDVFAVGFCFGGRKSFNQAARGHGLAGVIVFYGFPMPRDEDDDEAPVDAIGSFECKVLGLFGGADRAIPVSSVEAFRAALDAGDVPNEVVVYPGAPHSFFDRTCDEHREACDDAWRRMLAFVGSSAV